MTLQHSFTDFISKESLFTKQNKLLIAVSGGVDSVVLCDLCNEAGYDFLIAHCNFQLRGEESNRDEDFVLQLGRNYGKEVLVKHFATKAYAAQNKVSTQVAARELRYSWFYDLLDSDPPRRTTLPTPDSRLKTPDLLLTAHHADDNIETVLMNFFKGTGVSGMRGILPKQGKLIRPLLFATKAELLDYAKTKGLKWVEDSSNAGDQYTRNYFRHQVIPLLQKVYPQVDQNLISNISRFRDIEVLYKQSIALHKKKLLEQKGNEVHIPVLKLKGVKPLNSIVYEIIKDFSFSNGQVQDVLNLLESESGHFVASPTHRIIRNRNWLIIAPLASEEAANILIEEMVSKVRTANWQLQISRKNRSEISISSDSNTACVDASDIKFPLLLRKWKEGDYFYPLGMKKKKKVARFLIDQKISKTDKENIWVLEMNKKIVWVVGQRIDDRFKITDATKEVIVISVSNP
ncbi:MAG: tRNA lysidine(34) synthetase TilS [Chitinophagaceae bacterium]|nr:tRNA lysidine(34) synthetase TilS [Chitinophagaceae bacterium]